MEDKVRNTKNLNAYIEATDLQFIDIDMSKEIEQFTNTDARLIPGLRRFPLNTKHSTLNTNE